MKIDIITIFPNIFDSYFDESIIKRAREKNIVEINIINLRNFTTDKRKTVDDTPFGGGEGMVMMVEPIEKAVNSIKTQDSHVIALSAKGELFKQSKAKTLSQKKHLILICGRYEGFDQRILDEIADEV
ncbi:MAG TPA: tRNA (guanosine(37)-N1)-methyltransferase TrmD, partial [Candidatus Dojkabacteria bacterium]